MYVCECDVSLVFSLKEVEASIESVRGCRVVLVVAHELPIYTEEGFE